MPTLTRGSFATAGSSLQFRTGDWRLSRPEHRNRESPCAAACPAGENPQGYLARAAEGDLRAAWEAIVAANPIPAITGRVCPHPCESSCNRGHYDDPIAIHSVDRSLGDPAIEEGWDYPVSAPAADAAAVAIVGAGPAGRTVAGTVRGHKPAAGVGLRHAEPLPPHAPPARAAYFAPRRPGTRPRRPACNSTSSPRIERSSLTQASRPNTSPLPATAPLAARISSSAIAANVPPDASWPRLEFGNAGILPPVVDHGMDSWACRLSLRPCG